MKCLKLQTDFDRLGLDYRIVRADTGIMGGLLSEEFQAISLLEKISSIR